MADRDADKHLPLPQLSFYILLALGDGSAHGWALVKRIRELTDERTNPSSGSLYHAMLRLEDSGMIEESDAPASEESTDERRRYYRLTEFGREVARAEAQRLSRLVAHAERQRLLPASRNG